MSVTLDCVLALAFDRTHLLRMVVVVGECPVDIGHIDVVPVGDRARVEATVLD